MPKASREDGAYLCDRTSGYPRADGRQRLGPWAGCVSSWCGPAPATWRRCPHWRCWMIVSLSADTSDRPATCSPAVSPWLLGRGWQSAGLKAGSVRTATRTKISRIEASVPLTLMDLALWWGKRRVSSEVHLQREIVTQRFVTGSFPCNCHWKPDIKGTERGLVFSE